MDNIKHMRVSFLFTRTVLKDLNFSSKHNFGSLLNEALTNKINDKSKEKTEEISMTCPWIEDYIEKNHFWNFYLKGSQDKGALMKKVVPLFYNTDIKISRHKDSMAFKLGFEPYVYRHGIGIIISISINGNTRYEDLEKTVNYLREEKIYVLERKSTKKNKSGKMSLRDLSDALFDCLEEQLFIENSSLSKENFDPFSIVSISTSSQKIDKEEKKYSEKIGAFEEVPLKKRTEDRQIKMYSSKRIRVIWYPEREDRALTPIKTINCYRKNIEKLSLQIESLADFLNVYESIFSEKSNENFRHHARNSQSQLSRLYGINNQTENTTYMSNSSVVQINDNYFNLINNIKGSLYLNKLERKELSKPNQKSEDESKNAKEDKNTHECEPQTAPSTA